jgi:prepilin-type N-terminal cleavage/methylation domain-containing protein
MNFHREQRGYSLIELVVALSILAIISVAISMAISMINTHFHISKDQGIAWRQVQNAGFWVTRDLLTADNVVVDNDPMTSAFLTLTVPIVTGEEEDGSVTTTAKSIIYHLQDNTNGTKKLTRIDQDTGSQIIVAEYIHYDPIGDPASSTAVISDDPPKLTIRFTSIYNNAVSSQEYEAIHRVPN